MSLEANLLAFFDPSRDFDVERASSRQRDPCLPSIDRFLERHGGCGLDVLAFGGAALLAGSGALRSAPAEQIGKEVARIDPTLLPAKATAERIAARFLEIEAPRGATTRAATKTLESLVARLAVAIDLATVELAALGLVTQDLIGLIDLGKTILGLGILALIGMKFLGELAKGFLDILGCSRFLHTECRIGIAHHQPVCHARP